MLDQESFTNNPITPDYNQVINTFGLANYSSHCWANSLIQALLSLPPLVKLLKKSEYMRAMAPNSLVVEILKIVDSNGTSTVSSFTNTLTTFPHDPRFQQSGAQSVDEALTYFLDNCNELSPLFGLRFDRFGKCSDPAHKRDISIFATSYSYDIKMPCYKIFKNSSELSKLITLSGSKFDYPGACCPRFYDYTYLVNFSKIITITRNNLSQIDFNAPENIYLPIKYGQAQYILSAIICYTGGHYYTIARRGNKIYNFNDSSVNEVPSFNVDKFAHILFYTYTGAINSLPANY